ncbi:hypothetical protein GBA52_011906 [Prunus armeniaca]|nr:hypothetical protein GBA52_011906 [Prunus armeniaca]
MEMQPMQRGSHASFSCNSLGNNRLYNLCCSRARVVIKLWVEIPTKSFITETKWDKGKKRELEGSSKTEP